MKNLSFLAALVAGTALAGVAHASITVNAPFINMFEPGDTVTQFKITDFENALRPDGSLVTGPIVAGDTLQGIYNITSSQTTGGANVLNPGNFQVSGIFDTLVLSTTTNVDSAGDTAFTLGVDPNFNAHLGLTGSNALPAGAMIALYQGPANAFNASQGSISAAHIAAAYATVLNGATLAQVAGAKAGGVWGTDYYWAAVGSPNPGVSSFATSLNLLYSNPAIAPAAGLLAGTLTQQAPTSYGPASVMNALALIQNQIALQGNTIIQTDPNIPFEIQSQDPLREELLPEPTGIAVVGGLFGLWALGTSVYRRRARAA